MLVIPRWLPLIAGVTAAIYALPCLALYLCQRWFIYYPQAGSAVDEADALILTVGRERIVVRTRPHAGRDAVIYFGGNAEDTRASMPTLGAAFADRAIYALNYRGYGGSSGKASEAALIADALALVDRVRAEHANVILVGRSLGSGVAVHVASIRPIERLILVTPYDSLQAIAAGQFPFFPVRWLLIDKFESWRYARLVNAPTLIIVAEVDTVIPRANSESLYRAFRSSIASLTVLRGTGHNTVANHPDYVRLLSGAP